MGIKTRLLASGKTEDNEFNISLLGFKMAVNEGLTVFNLVDGVVDEFHDESGTDEAEGSNDLYCATSDFYTNNSQTTSTVSAAGFKIDSITEPTTSTAGTNPAFGSGTVGTFTVPTGMTSLQVFTFGAGGSGGAEQTGGGGGFSKGTLAVTGGQVLKVVIGEGGGGTGSPPSSSSASGNALTRAYGCGGKSSGGPFADSYGFGGGGGLSGVFANCFPGSLPQGTAPQAIVIAGSGGSSGYNSDPGGPGGGLTGRTGEQNNFGAQTSAGSGPNSNGIFAGGGDQEQGGQGGGSGNPGALFKGGNGASPQGHSAAGGGSGYYGGGGTGRSPTSGHAGNTGGGSSFYGHPQITSGTTFDGCISGAASTKSPTDGLSAVMGTNGPTITGYSPLIAPSNAELSTPGEYDSNGLGSPSQSVPAAGDGYVFMTGSVCSTALAQPGGGTSTIISNAFTSTGVPTLSRIVVFEENVDSPTLNTDIVASISRDNGSTFTTATLSDSGYVTGSSGQRILTGQAVISGQPSGQSMRWKLALANNTVKIHGVSLQWS
tara:strand:+ start:42 stop:1673 length:1632 start_codon:yes stop_codon:yes gene_type:complete